ncbi:uncharacterized protein A4U43_C07F15480 [Asparagus officinalis]|uniref:AAA+ ATPase domain-containing protein n=1 Tax=Asparagus officinalis TaxID=4686 RepID=A0A5P1EHD6_ASPOF|nr:vacuolar protein sorting-associated protein 4 [Asparagus officinalis]ONK63470.1 uncharacterized protein A4U43_C07F15480 [Asparagus officinalis]
MLRRIVPRSGKPVPFWQRVLSGKISTSSSTNPCHFLSKHHWRPELIGLQQSEWTSESSHSSSSSLLPISVMALLGIGVSGSLQTSLADGPPPQSTSESEASSCGVENLVIEERRRLEELLANRGMQRGSYPHFTVAGRGQKVTIKFKIPPSCEVSRLIVDLVSHLGLKAEKDDSSSSSEMLLRAWDTAAAWQVTLTYPEKTKETNETEKNEENLCVLIFESLVGSDFCEIEFIKKGKFSNEELDALLSALKLAGGRDVKRPLGKTPKTNQSRRNNYGNPPPSLEKSVSALEAMGVRVYGFDETGGIPLGGMISWDNLAGYEEQKREIEDSILLALQSPEVYDDIARGTRRKFETNRPRAVLFEGPPGTGKTSSARVIATQSGVPLVYVPLEVIMSKYYGESERLLGNVFSLANDIPEGAIIFLDEVDSFAVARDSEMHEATRRILSVLLRQIDGFEQEKRVVVIAATNRKEDLDPALISRFDSIICFNLPDQKTREEIVSQYAKHLDASEIAEFASVTDGMSGRDIRDVCQQAERHWASKLIRGQVNGDGKGKSLPPLEEYLKCAEQRQQALFVGSVDGSKETSSRWKPRALA